MDKLSPRDCVDLLQFCKRDMLSNCVKHKPDAWWLVMSRVFFLLLEMRDLDKLKSKFEMNIVMEKRMHDTCQYIEYGL